MISVFAVMSGVFATTTGRPKSPANPLRAPQGRRQLVEGLAFGLATGLTFVLLIGLAGGLALGLTFGLTAGLTREPGANLGARAIIRSDALAGLTFGLTGGLTLGLTAGLTAGAQASRRYAVFLLCSRRHLPFRLGLFLDWAVTAGLLRYSGPAYQYRHRELQHWLRQHPQPPDLP